MSNEMKKEKREEKIVVYSRVRELLPQHADPVAKHVTTNNNSSLFIFSYFFFMSLTFLKEQT